MRTARAALLVALGVLRMDVRLLQVHDGVGWLGSFGAGQLPAHWAVLASAELGLPTSQGQWHLVCIAKRTGQILYNGPAPKAR